MARLSKEYEILMALLCETMTYFIWNLSIENPNGAPDFIRCCCYKYWRESWKPSVFILESASFKALNKKVQFFWQTKLEKIFFLFVQPIRKKWHQHCILWNVWLAHKWINAIMSKTTGMSTQNRCFAILWSTLRWHKVHKKC